MKIYIPSFEKLTTTIGGGNTFTQNLAHAIKGSDIEVVSKMGRADTVLIIGPTTAERNEIYLAKEQGKKIILRLDGVCEDWRNRGTGISRMIDFCDIAHLVIYQSEFVRESVVEPVERLLGKKLNSKLIYNGVDTDIFNKTGPKLARGGRDKIYVHVHYRKDPNKRYEEVMHTYRMLHMKEKNIALWLIGRFPTIYREYKFGFWNNEVVQYLGIVNDKPTLAMYLRTADAMIFPSYADPAPNTVLEALACGLEITNVNEVGGTKELVQKWKDGYDFTMGNCLNSYIEAIRNV